MGVRDAAPQDRAGAGRGLSGAVQDVHGRQTMIDWAVFVVFALVGYAAARAAVPQRSRPPAEVPQPEPAERRAAWEEDAACRLLLALADEDESRVLRTRCETDRAFAESVKARRDELVRDYAAGRLPDPLRDAFRREVLHRPGIAQAVEVERALAAVADPEFGRLGMALTYRLKVVDRWWRKLTMDEASAPASEAAGPCLMIGPDAETDTAELVGALTAVEDDAIQVNLGARHGLGTGDFIQIERGNDGWIGTGVITSADPTNCRAVFMGETRPASGDRARAVLDGGGS
jgi:hypothetical protein